jgi:nitrite reductase (NO-forming)
MAVGSPSPHLRAAHVTVNLLGLVGLTIIGTLPFFAATVVRSRMAPRATPRRVVAVVGWQALATAVASVHGVAAAGLLAYACGIAGVLALVPTPTGRQLRWAGPRLVALWAGAAWWAVALVAAAGSGDGLAGRWLWVLVVAGYGQILWGSLAYLLPMLRGGGHERLGEGFATTRSWVGLAAANVAGLAFATTATPVAAAALAVWVLDALARGARVGLKPASREAAPV